MLRRLLLTLSLALALTALARPARATTDLMAEGHKFGLGLGGGTFTSGVSGKIFLGRDLALQATLGSWWAHGIAGGVDVLVEMPQLWSNGKLGLNWYVGGGGAAVLGSPVAIGVSGVAGLSLQVVPFPIDITAEWRPSFIIASEWGGLDLGGGGGSIRYWF